MKIHRENSLTLHGGGYILEMFRLVLSRHYPAVPTKTGTSGAPAAPSDSLNMTSVLAFSNQPAAFSSRTSPKKRFPQNVREAAEMTQGKQEGDRRNRRDRNVIPPQPGETGRDWSPGDRHRPGEPLSSLPLDLALAPGNRPPKAKFGCCAVNSAT